MLSLRWRCIHQQCTLNERTTARLRTQLYQLISANFSSGGGSRKKCELWEMSYKCDPCAAYLDVIRQTWVVHERVDTVVDGRPKKGVVLQETTRPEYVVHGAIVRVLELHNARCVALIVHHVPVLVTETDDLHINTGWGELALRVSLHPAKCALETCTLLNYSINGILFNMAATVTRMQMCIVGGRIVCILLLSWK